MRSTVQDIEIGPFCVELATGTLLRDGIEIELDLVSKHTVDVTVGEVRKALREFGSWIAHRPKLGYRLEVLQSKDLVRKGWHFWNRRTREGFEKAAACFRQAVAKDATDFRAYEGLSASYLTLGSTPRRLTLCAPSQRGVWVIPDWTWAKARSYDECAGGGGNIGASSSINGCISVVAIRHTTS